MSKSEMVFATESVTVHLGRKGKAITGRVMVPGDYLPLVDFTEFQQTKIKAGNSHGLKVMTEAAAKREKELLVKSGVIPPDTRAGMITGTKTQIEEQTKAPTNDGDLETLDPDVE